MIKTTLAWLIVIVALTVALECLAAIGRAFIRDWPDSGLAVVFVFGPILAFFVVAWAIIHLTTRSYLSHGAGVTPPITLATPYGPPSVGVTGGQNRPTSAA